VFRLVVPVVGVWVVVLGVVVERFGALGLCGFLVGHCFLVGGVVCGVWVGRWFLWGEGGWVWVGWVRCSGLGVFLGFGVVFMCFVLLGAWDCFFVLWWFG